MSRKKKNSSGNSAERQMVERDFDCDTDRLYGSLDDAIAYLAEIKQKYPDAKLDEHWVGYEDMTMRFVWYEEETDAEYTHRIESEKERVRQNALKEKQREERSGDMAEYNRLRRKLGLI